ncbi:MAG: hypothetical protein PHU80_06795 [Kiritimatiellae bacterium]|nr:hypothetical protein [Kiritimatiellia bacterium]
MCQGRRIRQQQEFEGACALERVIDDGMGYTGLGQQAGAVFGQLGGKGGLARGGGIGGADHGYWVRAGAEGVQSDGGGACGASPSREAQAGGFMRVSGVVLGLQEVERQENGLLRSGGQGQGAAVPARAGAQVQREAAQGCGVSTRDDDFE